MDGLSGKYEKPLDSTGRLAVPLKLRSAIPESQQDRIYITRGVEACVVGYCEEEWKRFKQKIDNMKLSYKEKAALRREFIGRAVEVSFDKQGRITLPVDLLKYAHLKDVSEVVVMGCDNTIEFWNPELYESNQAEAEEIVQRVMGENYFD